MNAVKDGGQSSRKKGVIRVIEGLVPGPYLPGQERLFKTDVIKAWDAQMRDWQHFRIETEETSPGFPDVASFTRDSYELTEFKVSDASGCVTFGKTQLLFYRNYRHIRIGIMVWDVPASRVLLIRPETIIEAGETRFVLPKPGQPLG
jgi:hypothetical protein